MNFKGLAVVVKSPKHTRNLFGPIDEIADRGLFVLDRNERGDCLCLFQGKAGQNMVDVDHQDVRVFYPMQSDTIDIAFQGVA